MAEQRMTAGVRLYGAPHMGDTSENDLMHGSSHLLDVIGCRHCDLRVDFVSSNQPLFWRELSRRHSNVICACTQYSAWYLRHLSMNVNACRVWESKGATPFSAVHFAHDVYP